MMVTFIDCFGIFLASVVLAVFSYCQGYDAGRSHERRLLLGDKDL